MEFGRVPSLEGVDFTLLPDPPENVQVLSALERASSPRVLMGCPQWGVPGNVGKIYPSGTRAPEYLYYYSRQFPTIELNSTFYGADPQRLAGWREATPEGFLFCPKFPREITHDLGLVHAERATERWLNALEALGPKLGVPWLLLPETFSADRVEILAAYLQAWPRALPLAVELRHPSWFADRVRFEEWAWLLEALGVILILTDVAGRRDLLHMRLTTSTAVVRFGGNRLDPTDFERIDAWIERLGAWFDAGLEAVYLFLHQPDEALNVEIAEYLGRRFAEIGLEIPTPRRVQRLEQGRLF